MIQTSGIERRLDNIQQLVELYTSQKLKKVPLSAADIEWLIILARSATTRYSREKMRLRKTIAVSTVSLMVFAGIVLTLLSLFGVV